MKYRLTDYGVKADAPELQTEAIQKVFDLCRAEGGTVVIPRGRFRTGGLRMWSDMTLYLESGAVLQGSDVCEDYPVFDVPEGVELRTDMELITQYYVNPWPEYRRAILSVYGGKNISIIGEPDSHVNGSDCCDPNGEEGYRGPHGIFLTNVDGVTLRGYSIEDCGNFMHQIDNCRNLTVKNVICAGGSDGFHLHFCVHTLIEDCVFTTGDDTVAGINVEDLTVRRCSFNTSCQVFRMGGSHILVEDCHVKGPGIYPHRMTIVPNKHTDAVRDRRNDLPREAGRHNTLFFWLHFASTNFPSAPYHDVVIRNCELENVDCLMHYMADHGTLESGTYLKEIRFENLRATGLKATSELSVKAAQPLSVTLKNVEASFAPDAKSTALFDPAAENVTLRVE